MRVLSCLIACCLLLLPLQGHFAAARDVASAPSSFAASGIDGGSSTNISALNIIQRLANAGMKVLNTTRRVLVNVIQASSGSLKRQARQTLNVTIKVQEQERKTTSEA